MNFNIKIKFERLLNFKQNWDSIKQK